MKTINETFTDGEYEQLNEMKKKLNMNWHDFILHINDKMREHWANVLKNS